MSYLFAERVTVTAKPSARDVNPYILSILPLELSGNQIKNVNIVGKSFFQLNNLYLSSSDVNYFDGLDYRYFNPFSNVANLSNKNPGFSAIVIPNFTIINENVILFEIPNEIFWNKNSKNLGNAYFDIIVENEAGYGLLSRDSYSYFVSSWRGFTATQKPCISGIFVTGY